MSMSLQAPKTSWSTKAAPSKAAGTGKMPQSSTVDDGQARQDSTTTPLTAALAPRAPGERWTQNLRLGLPGGRERHRHDAAAQWASEPPAPAARYRDARALPPKALPTARPKKKSDTMLTSRCVGPWCENAEVTSVWRRPSVRAAAETTK